MIPNVQISVASSKSFFIVTTLLSNAFMAREHLTLYHVPSRELNYYVKCAKRALHVTVVVSWLLSS